MPYPPRLRPAPGSGAPPPGPAASAPVPEGAGPILPRHLGAAVRRLRTANGVSQEAFADRIGIHRTAMSSLERGLTDAKLSTLTRVAAGLGRAVSDVLREVEREAAQETAVTPTAVP